MGAGSKLATVSLLVTAALLPVAPAADAAKRRGRTEEKKPHDEERLASRQVSFSAD